MSRRKATRTSSSKGDRNKILASAVINTGDTNVIAEDLYGEPTKRRLDGGQVWVRMFDKDASFLKNMMSLVNYSPTLRRIVNDKTNMAAGDGYIPIDGQSIALLSTLSRQSQQIREDDGRLEDLESALQRVNLYDETLDDVARRVFFEYDAFGNAVIELVRGFDASGPFVYMYQVPMYMFGLRKAGSDMLIASGAVFDDWESVDLFKDTEQMPEGFREIPMFPQWSARAKDGTERTLIHLKRYAPGFFYYGLPEWIAAQFWAEIEYRIAKFNINEFQNGFSFSGIVQLFGSVSPTEAQDIIDKMQAKFTDTGNARKMFVQVLRDERLKANVQQLSDIKDGHFPALQKLASQAIVTANRWTMSLAGFATSGKLGTNEQIRNEFQYVQNTVIKPLQNTILNRVINVYLDQRAKWTEASWAGITLGISNNTPVSFMGEISPEKVLTDNEKREIIGYEPLDDAGLQEIRTNRQASSNNFQQQNNEPVNTDAVI